MCAEASEVESAAERIGLLGSDLGVTMATKKGELQSKVSVSLLTNRPAHHAALKVQACFDLAPVECGSLGR